jgi:hypothetical protein
MVRRARAHDAGADDYDLRGFRHAATIRQAWAGLNPKPLESMRQDGDHGPRAAG